MNEPVRVLSDLHLGHKISRIPNAAALRPLIAGAGTVIFNGDTWQELAIPFRGRSADMLRELREICREEGAEAIFLPGNHDPGWPGPGWLELAGGRIVITHGDALLRAASPWKREILSNSSLVEEIWDKHPRAGDDIAERIQVAREIASELRSVEHPLGRAFLQRVWDALVPPRRAWKMIEAWATQAARGNDFCERYFPRAEVLVIGHFHREGAWKSGGRRVIDLGSFMAPGRAHWLDWQGGFLTRGVVDESGNECRRGKILDVWRL